MCSYSVSYFTLHHLSGITYVFLCCQHVNLTLVKDLKLSLLDVKRIAVWHQISLLMYVNYDTVCCVCTCVCVYCVRVYVYVCACVVCMCCVYVVCVCVCVCVVCISVVLVRACNFSFSFSNLAQ